MNEYEVAFYATCPANGIRIAYTLTIGAGADVIRVEEIVAEVEEVRSGFHEQIADRLFARFGGAQRLVADHHGVKITTTRGSA